MLTTPHLFNWTEKQYYLAMPTIVFFLNQYFNTDLFRPLAGSVQLHHLDLKPTKNIYQNYLYSGIIAEVYLILFFLSLDKWILIFMSIGASPSLSPVSSPSHCPPAAPCSSQVTRSPVEFPDTADFLTKPSVNLHKPLGYMLSSPDFQQPYRGASSAPLCTRYSNI